MKQQSNKKRPENARKCICKSLELQNFPGEHAPDPPRVEGKYTRLLLLYPLVQKLIETPAQGVSQKLNLILKKTYILKTGFIPFFEQKIQGLFKDSFPIFSAKKEP